MAERARFGTLKMRGIVWTLTAFVAGGLASGLWITSQSNWKSYLNQAYLAGFALHDTLIRDAPAPPDLRLSPVTIGDLSDQGTPITPEFGPRTYVTSVSILTDPILTLGGRRIQLRIVSPDLQYPVADLPPADASNTASKVADVARLLASLCSEPVVFARVDQGAWLRVHGDDVWGCAAAPRDLRLLALAVGICGLLICISLVAETAGHFAQFTDTLRLYGRTRGRAPLPEEGPEELQSLAKTLNAYLETEQDRLHKRALVLSGVSHDLGTPATRLRLRTALIDDAELRQKLETDIDLMTGMIESVLTYTRAEISAEDPVELSLTSVVQAVVADYDDVGKPVRFMPAEARSVERSRTLFAAAPGSLMLPSEEARRVLITARPVALRRAIGNLVDNALKYGRRAAVSVHANSGEAAIIVEDEGTTMSEDMLDRLTKPFLRGENAGLTDGVGLGLTIVSTIAQQHGGALTFERVPTGLRAILTIRRA
ncbi:HAMP domain-containing sensor histidine kinase [Thalassococcus sp. S3]|uniref:sensor histidine kinase n=1 Tax=Thalassococcus sp. S3 TaxID=2017482 RepID=UPI0020C33020|nr:ATP-binding protein [Thalassococcus sp. S3]